MTVRYHAPAVAYDFERPAWVVRALLALWVLLAAVMLAWRWAAQWTGSSVWLGAILIVAAWLLRRHYVTWPQGRLCWDGQAWAVELRGSAVLRPMPVRVRVGLDGGGWLWLEGASDSGAGPISIKNRVLWIFLSQHHSPAQWGDLRRAVYSSA